VDQSSTTQYDYHIGFCELIDLFPSGLYVIRDEVIIDCNQTALEMFGFSDKSEILGKKPYELSPELQHDGSPSVTLGKRLVENALFSSGHSSFHWIHRRKNNENFLSSINLYNIKGILFAVITDLHEIDHLKKQIKYKDDMYRLMFENHNSAMLIIDPETGKILESNAAASSFYGYGDQELSNLYIQNINILSDLEIKEEMSKAKSEKRNYFLFTHKLASGALKEVEVHSFPIATENGKLLFSIVHDISEKVEQRLMFDTLFNDSPYAVVILGKDKLFLNTNRSFCEMFQYSPEEVIRASAEALLSPDGKKGQIEEHINHVFNGNIIKTEGTRRRKDGTLIDVEIFCYPILSHKSVIGAYLIYIDISERKNQERQLKVFKKVLESSSEGFVITDPQTRIQWCNTAFSNITGYGFDEVRNQKINFRRSEVHDAAFYEIFWEALNHGGKWTGEIWNKNKHGDVYPEWLRVEHLLDHSGEIAHYVGAFRDMSEKVKQDQFIADLEQKDLLTGLYNQRYFLKFVESLISKSSGDQNRFAIAYMHLNRFKEINDSLGRDIGDEILVQTTDRIKQVLGERALFSRFYEEQFVLLLENFRDKEALDHVCSSIKTAVDEPLKIQNLQLYVSSRLGIALYPEHGTDGETLIRNADLAMHKAKLASKYHGCVCFTESMATEIHERFSMTNDLVLAASREELFLEYQPIVHLGTKETIGLEALIRWRHPKLGLLSPVKFIPIAEQTGLIIEIGLWVAEEVCRQLKAWHRSGFTPVPVSINVSAIQLEQLDFADRIARIVQDSGVESSLIKLEITESVSLGDVEVVLGNLAKLKSRGFEISLDDFGTGYSSFSSIEELRVDLIKIDRSFIMMLDRDAKNVGMINSALILGRSFGLKTVAEGIETEAQLAILQGLKCDYGQGYFFSRPVSPKCVQTYLKRRMGELVQ